MKVADCFLCKRKKKRSKEVQIRSIEGFDMTSSQIVPSEMFEGQLSKYTNVVKGWQFRWFILDSKTGFLNYYLMENEKTNRPRGRIHLRSAVISPSEDDSNSFSVKPKIGEIFKLRAQDAKIRQEWVDRLRIVSEDFAIKYPSSGSVSPDIEKERSDLNQRSSSAELTVIDAFNSVKGYLDKAERSSALLSTAIDQLPTSGQVTHTDNDILMLKASSQSTIICLNQCYSILKQLSNDNKSDVVNRNSKTEAPHSSKKTSV